MIHWRSFGQGPDPALVIHCALAHSGVWRGVAAGLSDRLALQAFDLVGHGRSAPWDGVTDLHDANTDAALTALDAPAHLIGHSFGATVALRIALEHPDCVRTLTLIEPVWFKVAAPDALATYLTDARPFADALTAGDLAGAAKAFTATWGAGPAWEMMPPEMQASMAAQMPLIEATQSFLIEDDHNLLRAGLLEGCAVPTCLIRGATSPAVIAAIHQTLAARLPDAQDHVVEGAGHMAPITHAGEVATLIRPHLDRG